VFCGNFRAEPDQLGVHPTDEVYAWGVDEILSIDDHSRITDGVIDLGKRLRPNLRARPRRALRRAQHGR
jgi:hypothetical protein